MSADAACGAGWGERSPERVNRRNGYRGRDWDTRVWSIEFAVPKLRQGSGCCSRAAVRSRRSCR